jgi:hypothetical protein
LHSQPDRLKCSYQGEGHTDGGVQGKSPADAAESENLGMRGNSRRENREILFGFRRPTWHVTGRRNRCRGEMIVVRYADDFVMGFENYSEGQPETFDFLGFTHQCARTREQGWFALHRHTIAKRMRATLQAIKAKLRKRMHRPLGETGRWLRSVVQGWLNYHAVPGHSNRLQRFVDEVTRLWLQVLRRRQRGRTRWTWERMQRLARRHLPRPRILHPYPNQRFRARLKARAV